MSPHKTTIDTIVYRLRAHSKKLQGSPEKCLKKAFATPNLSRTHSPILPKTKQATGSLPKQFGLLKEVTDLLQGANGKMMTNYSQNHIGGKRKSSEI